MKIVILYDIKYIMTTITVESRIYNPPVEILESYGTLQQTISRTLFNYLVNNEKNKDTQNIIKKEYLAKYRIHSRLFNSIWNMVNGTITCIKANTPSRINYLKQKIQELKNKATYNLKNKLEKYKNRLKQAEKREISAIWGGKAFYKKQWNAENHDEWLKEWRRRRNYKIYSIGSKDENFGNSLCQIQTLSKIRLTLPYCIQNKYGKHAELQVDFNKNKQIYDYLKQAISNNQALTYTIMQRENGHWYVQISFSLPTPQYTDYRSCLGIDINYDLFTTCEIKEDGNPSRFQDYNFETEGKTSNQVREQIITIARNIVQRAKDNKQNIVVEDINLDKSKNKDQGKISNRKKHMVVYRKFIQSLKTCAVKNGVLVIDINPAFTSVSARYKYSKQLGRSVHSCAALTIARRGQRRREKIPTQIACLLRSGERKKSNWAQWSLISKRLKPVQYSESYVAVKKLHNDLTKLGF